MWVHIKGANWGKEGDQFQGQIGMYLGRQKEKKNPCQKRSDLIHKVGMGTEVTTRREKLLKAVRLMDQDSDNYQPHMLVSYMFYTGFSGILLQDLSFLPAAELKTKTKDLKAVAKRRHELPEICTWTCLIRSSKNTEEQ